MERKLAYLHTLRRTAITVVLLVLCLPLFAQYNIKKLMDEGRSSLDNGYYVVAMQIFQRVVSTSLPCFVGMVECESRGILRKV